MNRTLQSIFSGIDRTGEASFNPGNLALIELIRLEVVRIECLRDCDGPIYSNDTRLALASIEYKIRGRDGKAGKTTFFNDSDSVIVIREEGDIIAVIIPHETYSPPFGCTGEIYASSSMNSSLLRVTTQRFCDCGDAPAYIDSEPIGSFLL